MHKRKNIGIIKYGPRLSKNKTTQKFQSGGVASVESGYEWREDPYELMLMRQKESGLEDERKRRSAARKKASSSSNTKDPKIGNFDVLEGGLFGTRTALNQKYKALQQQYRDEIASNPPSWVSTIDSQKMFQHVVTVGQEFQEILRREQKQFNDAKAKLNTSDSEALAISSNNNMMVINKDTKEYEFVHMTTYLDQMERYEPQKLEDFMYWKENIDTSGASGDVRSINEFMVNNAISPEKVISQYINPNLNAISYIEHNGFIEPQDNAAGNRFDSTKAVAQMDNWNATIAGAISGNEPKNINPTSRTSIMDAINVIYKDILGNTADRSRLQASLYAEVLKDNGHKSKMAAMKTNEERAAYLEKQASLALVNKIYTKGSGKTSTESEGVGYKGKGESNAYIAGLYRLEAGDEHGAYVYGSDFMTGAEKDKRRAVDVVVPKVNGIAKNGHLKLVVDPEVAKKDGTTQNTVTGNTFMTTYTNTDNVYLENGMSLNSELGAGQAGTFLKDNVRIDPSTDVDLVYIFMDAEGNVTMDEGKDIAALKLENRASFIKAYNDNLVEGMDKITVKPEDMLLGSNDPAAKKAYTLFQNWADSSADVDILTAEARKNLSPDNMRRRRMAQAAADMRARTGIALGNLRTKHLVPMAKITVLVDNDGNIDMFDMAEAHSKKTGYGDGIHKGDVSEGDQDYMQDTNGVDNWNVFKDWTKMTNPQPFGDDVYKMNILVPMSDMGSIVSGYGITKGSKIEELSTYKNIEDASKSVINMGSAITNPGNVEALSKFIRE